MRPPGDAPRVPHPARRVSALAPWSRRCQPKLPCEKSRLPRLFRRTAEGGMRGSPLVDSARRVSVALAAGLRMRARLLPRVGFATAAQRLRARCSIASAVLACERADRRDGRSLRARMRVWCALRAAPSACSDACALTASTYVCAWLQMSKV